MKLSIVTTLYKSERFVKEFYERVQKVARELTEDYEIVFVNDGSPDHSSLKVLEIRNSDPKVKLIELSRNFGHHKAVMTGLKYTKGDYVFLLDSDLEEEPELLTIFYKEMSEQNVDVVFGVQKTRKGGFVERITGKIFYKIFNNLADVPIEENILMARLMNKQYIEALKDFSERELFLGGVFALVGYTQLPIEVKKLGKGTSTYSTRRKLALLVNAITSSTKNLLIYVFYLGLIISFVSFLFIMYYLISSLFYKDYLSGWPSLILSIWFLSGLIILSVGILGIYLSKIFEETKQRPLTIIKKIYDEKNTKQGKNS
ncbi:putative glycosyltransferase [Aquimarina sp. MAR_2010_214]|uniref:glycosyltransferase family 2 protein n=1 Tax=Aquimarina sp. MAR_2010_214 TaxID=1250026 RepID=UPI000C709BE8|nr:glycosyltransferase family 2 protein [Aquimarina sp. MAR_2010_214]PKV49787.1 putative glycosyltransferase [Aquimarina sp. MAR_2010_214]